MEATVAEFPLDDATLVMLAAACEINPETGQTHLMDFLHMGAVETEREEIDDGMGGAPVFEITYAPGAEPFSPQQAIRALVEEVQRLRRG